MGDPKRTHSFSNAQLYCKNECGFYGNSMWEGYCSLCWRKMQRSAAEELNEEVTPWFDLASIVNFEEKKKHDSKRTSLSSLFSSPSQELNTEIVPKSEQVSRHILVLVEKKTKGKHLQFKDFENLSEISRIHNFLKIIFMG